MIYKYINVEYLESVSGGDINVTIDLVALFREQTEEFHKEMLALYGNQDYYSLGLLAHKAKSSVAIMGMTELAAMLKNFELEAKEGKQKDNYKNYIERFYTDTGEALKELDDYIKNS